MFKISLIRPVYQTALFDPEIQEPLGIETLAGLLRQAGHTVQLLDPMLTGQKEIQISRRVAAFRPDVIGFSLMSAGDLPSANQILSFIRDFGVDCWTAVGGNLVSTEPETALQGLPPGTICIRYEGEKPWLDLLDCLTRGRASETIGSAMVKKPDGTVIRSDLLPPVENLDSQPFASRDFMDVLLTNQMAVNIQGSRGCVGACSYCCAPGFPKSESDSRRDRSPAHIVDEMVSIVHTYQAKIFNFVDDDFIGQDEKAGERVLDFCKAIEERDLKISFGIQARPFALNKETIRLLSSAGLSYIFFGLESDDRQVLHSWSRKESRTSLGDLVSVLREYDIEAQAGNIMFHPGSTFFSIRKLANLLVQHSLFNYRTAANRLKALPGSKMYSHLERQGSIPKNTPGPYLPVFKDKEMDSFYLTFTASLEPLRPVWVYAASRLPAQAAYARLDQPGYRNHYAELKQILDTLDQHITQRFFGLLDAFEAGRSEEINIEQLTGSSFQAGMTANNGLFRLGLVENPDMLREAVRMDCGL